MSRLVYQVTERRPTCQVVVKIPVVRQQFTVIQKIRRLQLLLVCTRGCEMRVKLFTRLKYRILGCTVFQSRLESSLGVARA